LAIENVTILSAIKIKEFFIQISEKTYCVVMQIINMGTLEG
jgi:hypothetical protein